MRAVRRLPDSTTAALHRIDLVDGRRLVLRRYVWAFFLVEEPIAPQREADALRFAHANGVAVPEFVAADVTGEEVGDGVPAVLMTFVGGKTVEAPDVRRMAEVAAAIHSVDATKFDHVYYPWCVDELRGPPVTAKRPDLWAAAIELRAAAMPAYRPVFVHRDFHPGNVLWSRGRCSGIVDWVNACRGPVGCDVAHCRANLIELAGEAVADQFVAVYESLTGTIHDPYWDVASVLEHTASKWTPPNVAAAERRLERGLSSARR